MMISEGELRLPIVVEVERFCDESCDHIDAVLIRTGQVELANHEKKMYTYRSNSGRLFALMLVP